MAALEQDKSIGESRKRSRRNRTEQQSFISSRAKRDEEFLMIRKFAIAGLLTGAMALSACNTFRGAKADVNSAGKTVEKATDGK